MKPNILVDSSLSKAWRERPIWFTNPFQVIGLTVIILIMLTVIFISFRGGDWYVEYAFIFSTLC